MRRLLIVASNPPGTERLRLDQEVREIEHALRRAKQRDQFELKTLQATRPQDIRQALLDYDPHVVHFCGHGEGQRGLFLESNDGTYQLVSASALANLFKLFANHIECVLLNACYTDVQAEAIVKHIDAVIGISKPISDNAAICFAEGFYSGLGAGKDIEFSYHLGKTSLEMEGFLRSHIPILKRKGISQPPLAIDPTNGKKARIVISYKRDVEPDESMALKIFKTLNETHDVFIDQKMMVGTPWAEKIKSEIQQADALIVLLSENTVSSEMVQMELAIAHETARSNKGRPTILPVRLNYRKPFQYPLSAYLNAINWTMWKGPNDTRALLEELQKALSGESLSISSSRSKTQILEVADRNADAKPSPAAQPMSFNPSTGGIAWELPEGTMAPDSQFYVAREFDRVANKTIQQSGVTITIKGPRQMGKSSLLTRLMNTARITGKQIAFLDFQLFDKESLSDADTFFLEFSTWLTDELELEDKVDEYWKRRLSNTQRCTRYMGKYLLPALDRPLLLAMDEVETMFDTSFRSNFFGMLRSWHNNRATKPKWQQLDIALVTSTEPYQLIENLNQSPFNVGQILELTDFEMPQIMELNRRYGSILSDFEIQQMMELLNGHPYLIRKTLYLVASDSIRPSELFAQADQERGPFGDHLRYHLFRMYDKPELIQGFQHVVRHHTCPDERIFFKLRGAGLVRRLDNGLEVVPRCRLYEQYFQQHLK